MPCASVVDRWNVSILVEENFLKIQSLSAVSLAVTKLVVRCEALGVEK